MNAHLISGRMPKGESAVDCAEKNTYNSAVFAGITLSEKACYECFRYVNGTHLLIVNKIFVIFLNCIDKPTHMVYNIQE